jgi:transposase-like protein
MVEERQEPGASVSLVARRHGVNPNQLFTWRRLAAQGAFTAAAAGEEVVPASDYRALQEQIRELHRLDGVMRLQACTAPVLQTVVDESQRLAHAAMQDSAHWTAKGYGQSESRRAVRRLRAFLAEATAMLDPIFPPLTTTEKSA